MIAGERALRLKYVAQMQRYQAMGGTAAHNEVVRVYNSQTPLPVGYALKAADAWCAATVSAAAIASGLTEIIPCECSCPRQITLFQKMGRWQEDEAATPEIGDIVYYDWQDSGTGNNTGTADHVGVVSSVSGSGFTVIEGNKNGGVGTRELTVNGKYLRGFGRPNFLGAVQVTGIGGAIEKLGALGIMNSPQYWREHYGDLTYLDLLLVKAANAIAEKGAALATPAAGIDALVKAGVINTGEYWKTHCPEVLWLGDLLQLLGGSV